MVHIRTLLKNETSSKEGAEKTKLSIQKDGLKVRDLAFLIILNVLGRELTSGRYHTYRGVLNLTGKQMLELWYYSVGCLKDNHYYTETEAANDLKWIRDEIKKVG